jgi:hypothetical protein
MPASVHVLTKRPHVGTWNWGGGGGGGPQDQRTARHYTHTLPTAEPDEAQHRHTVGPYSSYRFSLNPELVQKPGPRAVVEEAVHAHIQHRVHYDQETCEYVLFRPSLCL